MHFKHAAKLYKQICTLKDTHVRNIQRIDYDSKEQTQGYTETDELPHAWADALSKINNPSNMNLIELHAAIT